MILTKTKRKVRRGNGKLREECGEVHTSKVSCPHSNKCKGQNGNIEKEKESWKGSWIFLGLLDCQSRDQ